MIFALRHPVELLGLVLGFLVGMLLRAGAQRAVNDRGVRPRGRGGLHQVGARPGGLRPRAGWAAYLDPYGTIAAVLGGAGWSPRQELRRRGARDVEMLLVALVVHAALAAVGFIAYQAAGGDLTPFGRVVDVSDVLHGDVTPVAAGQAVALGFAMINLACGLLALLPIPPLELGVVLWSRLPRSAGSRRFAFHLLEEQWGVAAVLLLILLPLGGQSPLLLVLINDAAAPILRAL